MPWNIVYRPLDLLNDDVSEVAEYIIADSSCISADTVNRRWADFCKYDYETVLTSEDQMDSEGFYIADIKRYHYGSGFMGIEGLSAIISRQHDGDCEVIIELFYDDVSVRKMRNSDFKKPYNWRDGK